MNVEQDVIIFICEWLMNIGFYFINMASGGKELCFKMVYFFWVLWIYRNDLVFNRLLFSIEIILKIFIDCKEQSFVM